MYSAVIHLLVSAAYFVFFISTTTAYAQLVQDFPDNAKKYYAEAKELEKTDAFNIRIALRRAVSVEQPYKAFRWNNKYTKHHGEVMLLDFIQPRHGRFCVNYRHTYFMGAVSPSKDEGMVCTNNAGRWGDIMIRLRFSGSSTAETSPVEQRQYTTFVWEVQDLLARLNYNPGPIDGRVGQRTRRAIEHYQRDEGLSITGDVSKELVASLEQSVAILEALPSTPKTDNQSPPSIGSSSSDANEASRLTERSVGVAILQRGDNDAGIEMSPSPVAQADTGGQKAPVDSPATDAIPGQNKALPVQDKSQISAVFKEIFDSIWSTAIIGFVFCVIVGTIASRSLTSKVNSSTIGHAQMGRVTEEFDQSSEGTDRAVVSIRKQRQGYKQSKEDAQIKRVSTEGNEGMKDSRSIGKRSQEDAEDTITQVITELDEIIKEAEEILMLSNLEENFRGYIIKAVEDAKTSIKKAFDRDPVGGGFHEQTAKALREAKELIEDALASNPSTNSTSLLRFE